jgi:hypothetical protein
MYYMQVQLGYPVLWKINESSKITFNQLAAH